MPRSYTFQVHWPVPYQQGWQTSGRSFPTVEEAAKELADFLACAFDNGCVLRGRLKTRE